jgi:hypothetical protein
MSTYEKFVPAYVKVEIRSRLPKAWGWSIHREANGFTIEHSPVLFRYAEDALTAGQATLKTLTIPALVD